MEDQGLKFKEYDTGFHVRQLVVGAVYLVMYSALLSLHPTVTSTAGS